MKYRSPLAQVIGLGSAKQGSGHWWLQRITAAALVPLTLWFVYSILTLNVIGDLCANQITQVYEWLSSPVVSTLMIAFVASLFYHVQLGMQVILEDYVHNEAFKIFFILLVKSVFTLLAILSIVSVLRITFGSVS